jgi:hypothetical protein
VRERDENSDGVDNDMDLSGKILDLERALEYRLANLVVVKRPFGGTALLAGQRSLNRADRLGQLGANAKPRYCARSLAEVVLPAPILAVRAVQRGAWERKGAEFIGAGGRASSCAHMPRVVTGNLGATIEPDRLEFEYGECRSISVGSKESELRFDPDSGVVRNASRPESGEPCILIAKCELRCRRA